MGRKRRGLSVLEVLIGVTILLVGFLFLLGIFPFSFQGITRARNQSFAGQLAQQNLENFVTWYSTSGSNGFVGGGAPPTASSTSTLVGEVNGAPVSTNFKWQVVGTPDCGTPNLSACALPITDYNVVQVDSWVQWTEFQGSLITAPSGAPADITPAYGAHYLSFEEWVYLP